MSTAASILLGFSLYAAALALIGFACGVRRPHSDLTLGGRRLNRYLVAIAAASAGNSGFIMTGAVGLGYAYGLKWVLLPLAWFLGDLAFWHSQPSKLNNLARTTDARSIPGLLAGGVDGISLPLRRIIGLLVVAVAGLYACSQFIASGKMFGSFTGIDPRLGVSLTLLVVGLYSITGGFRATVWSDVLQMLVMVLTTAGVITVAITRQLPIGDLLTSLKAVSSDFLSLTGTMSAGALLGFVAGWASAALGFGLSQPHLVLMYMAGKSPQETLSAKWTYMALLQFTWIGMTVFGVLARPMIAQIDDPETTLAHFCLQFCWLPFTIIAFAGVFSAIASTVDALVISSVGTLIDDVFHLQNRPAVFRAVSVGFVITAALCSLLLPADVFGTAALAVSLLACSIGPLVLLKLNLGHLRPGLLLSLLLFNVGLAVSWRVFGLSNIINEACPAMTLALLLLFILRRKPPIPARTSVPAPVLASAANE